MDKATTRGLSLPEDGQGESLVQGPLGRAITTGPAFNATCGLNRSIARNFCRSSAPAKRGLCGRSGAGVSPSGGRRGSCAGCSPTRRRTCGSWPASSLGLVGDGRVQDCLTAALRDEDAQINELAEHALWSIWFPGRDGRGLAPFSCRGMESMEKEDTVRRVRPFPAGRTRRTRISRRLSTSCAIAHYLLEEYVEAIDDSPQGDSAGAPATSGRWRGWATATRRWAASPRRRAATVGRCRSTRECTSSRRRCGGSTAVFSKA